MYLTNYAATTRIALLVLASLLMLPDMTFGQRIPSLKDTFGKGFIIDTALNTAQIDQQDTLMTAFIVSQFNMRKPST